MTLRLREKLPTTAPSIRRKAANALARKSTLIQNGLRLTLASLILLQPFSQHLSNAAGDTQRQKQPAARRLSRSATSNAFTTVRHKRTKSKARPTKPKATWTTQKSLSDSNDQLNWSRPRFTNLDSLHNQQPSYILPPKDMKRAELPADLAAPGDVVKSIYIEPTSGNEVVTAEASPVQQANYNDFAPLQLESPKREPQNSDQTRHVHNRTEQRVARLQDSVFGDADLGDTDLGDDTFDADAFPDTSSSLPDTDVVAPEAEGFESTLEDETGIDSTFGDESETFPDDDSVADDEAFSDTTPNGDTTSNVPDGEPRSLEGEFGTDPFPDDETPNNDGDGELPTPTDADDAAGVGPIRRPEGGSDDADEQQEIPADLSLYNGRNCPEEQAVYHAAWEAFQQRPIQAIDLNLTPEFDPNAPREQMAEKRDETLSKMSARPWRNREGEIVATGTMRDFKNGRVTIESDSGETKDIEFRSLSSGDMCAVSAWWGIPTEYQHNFAPAEIRNFTMQTFTWKASGVCHKPLYFEEVQLERYGHSAGPVKQTMLSGVHFFGNILALPYKMGVHPPNECQYALGYYRPGDCAPWLLHAIPLSARGARWQTAAVLGGIGLVP